MQNVSTTAEYFSTLGERLVKENIGKLDATFQFELSGDGGGTWHVTFGGGEMTVTEGAHTAPTTTLMMDAGDYIKMVNGEIDGRMAALTRKLKLKGSKIKARKLDKIIPPNKKK
jgi:putative sterol carrier protein